MPQDHLYQSTSDNTLHLNVPSPSKCNVLVYHHALSIHFALLQETAALEEDDDDWDKFQSGIGKRDRVLEGRSKMSHSVHCPHFPEVIMNFYS
ncbi:secretory subunit [Homalodisca vitripennis]|nr:secretory subunit [Homalodisca vitripennis]